MGIDISKFLDTFYEESFEGLDSMESGLLNMEEGDVDDEEINTIFRAAHSMKGGSGTFGLNNITDFTHIMETLLDEMREGKRKISNQDIKILLRSVDCLRSMLTSVKSGGNLDQALIDALKAEMNHSLENPAGDSLSSTTANSSSDVEPEWHIAFFPESRIIQTGNEPIRLLRQLKDLGNIKIKSNYDKLPDLNAMDPLSCYLSWEITIKGNTTKEAIMDIFEWVYDESKIDITCDQNLKLTSEVTQSNPASSETTQISSVRNTKKPVSSTEATSIRVAIDKVDALINMVGELVITQSMLSQLGQDFDMDRLDKLTDGLAQLDRNTRELQEGVMRIRMLPISFAFQRFPRMVYDLSHKLNKIVELKTSGENTEIDKTVMEKIGDPLVHLVRNAIDHGIELPDDRIAAGKQKNGTIVLNAYHQGGNIVIEIQDDGNGLNKEKIISKARQQGLVAVDESLTDERIYDLLFHPGFSTANEVSDISGRGVGMDVVRKNIRALGGNIEVISEMGKGSTFIIRLPLTLAILDGQLVKVGGETFIIPLISIVETLQMDKKYINAIAGKAELYALRDEYIPIIRLYDILNIQSENKILEGGLLVVVEGDGQRASIFVDDLLSQQQVVIKSLETNFRKVSGISGATILGDGTVALILDIPGIVEFSRNRIGQSKRRSSQAA